MKTAPRSYVALFCVFLMLNAVYGCLYIPQNTLPKVGDLPPLAKGTEKLLLTYSFSSKYLYTNTESTKKETTDSDEQTAAKYEYEFTDVFGESGYFSTMSPSGDWDIDIEMQYIYEADEFMRLLGLLSLCTLYVLPAYMPESYHLTAIVTAQNEEKHAYSINENGVTTFAWLPLLFVQGKCTEPKKTEVEIRKNMWKTLLFKMQQDGIIPTQTVTGAKTVK